MGGWDGRVKEMGHRKIKLSHRQRQQIAGTVTGWDRGGN